MDNRKQKKTKKRSERKAKSKQNFVRKAQEAASLEEVRKTGQALKPFLQKVGCDMAFYDYLDSYEVEFNRIVQAALSQRKSLVRVHEVSAEMLDAPQWDTLGHADLQQLYFTIPDECEDYVKTDAQANLRGSATFFLDQSAALKSVILIQKRPPNSNHVKDLQYALKIPGLFHEIGHVIDAEQGINIRLDDGIMDVVAAEVFAHVYALEQMASRSLRQSYKMLFDALEKMSELPDYVGDIGKGVMKAHARVQIPDWSDYTEAAMEFAKQR